MTGPTSVAGAIGSPSTSLLGARRDAFDELVGERRGATISRDVDVHRWPDGAERAEQRAVDDEVEIGVGEHDHRVLAAELERHEPRARAAIAAAATAPAGRYRAGERDGAHAGVRRDRGARLADSRAPLGRDPSGTPASRHAATNSSQHCGACSDGLITMPLPGEQRREDLPRRDRDREVPRRDHPDDADRMARGEPDLVGHLARTVSPHAARPCPAT